MKKQMIIEQMPGTNRNIVLWLNNGFLSGIDYWEGIDETFTNKGLFTEAPDNAITEYVLNALREGQRELCMLPHPDYDDTLRAIDEAITAYEQEQQRKGQLMSFRMPQESREIVREALRCFREAMEQQHPETFPISFLKRDIDSLEVAFHSMIDVVIPVGDYEEWNEGNDPIPKWMLNFETK